VEEKENLRNGREYPRFRAGDSIEIEKLPYMSATTPDIIKGVVIAKCNRASDTNIILLNVKILYCQLISSIIMRYITSNRSSTGLPSRGE